MLATIYNGTIETSNAKKLLSHMLQNMDFDKYDRFLHRVRNYPDRDHRFVMLEYVESPSSSPISMSERVPGSKLTIHNVIMDPDFGQHMMRLFVNSDNVNWYTRRKLDYTKPFGMDQLTNTRQLVLVVKGELDEMPPLIPVETTTPVFNPEEDRMPPLISLGRQSPVVLNQTIWNPQPRPYSHLSPNTNWIP
jgi:hypothetical protein